MAPTQEDPVAMEPALRITSVYSLNDGQFSQTSTNSGISSSTSDGAPAHHYHQIPPPGSVGEVETWLAKSLLHLSGQTDNDNDKHAGSRVPKWKLNPNDPTMSMQERKSIIKAIKCRGQRVKILEKIKNKDNDIKVLKTDSLNKNLFIESLKSTNARQADEIAKLREENDRLRKQIAALHASMQPPCTM